MQTIFEIAALKESHETLRTSSLARSELADLWVRKTYDLQDTDDMPKSAFEFVDSAIGVRADALRW